MLRVSTSEVAMKRTAFFVSILLLAALPLCAADPPPAAESTPAGSPPSAQSAGADASGLLASYGQIFYAGVKEAEWGPYWMTPLGPPGYLDAYSWGFVRYRDWFMAERYGWGWPPNPSPQGWGYDSWYGGWYGWMPNGHPAWGSGLGQYLAPVQPWMYCWECVSPNAPPPAPVAGTFQPIALQPPTLFKPLPGATGLPPEDGTPVSRVNPRGKPEGDPGTDPATSPAPEKPKRKWFSPVPPEERVPMNGSGLSGNDPWSNPSRGSGKGSRGARPSQAPRPAPPVHRAPPPPPVQKVS